MCEHCASGCQQRTDHRRGKVMRRLAGDDPQVNEEWNCDKGRWAFTYATEPDRLTTPLVRDADGGWSPRPGRGARAAARGLTPPAAGTPAGLPPQGPHGAGVLTGGRLTLEDAYAYAKFARVALGTNDIDFRARPHSAEEAAFLAARVAGHGTRRQLRRPGARPGRAAGRLRARGRVADRLPAAAQGGPQVRAARLTRSRRSPPAGWPSSPAACSPPCPGEEARASAAWAGTTGAARPAAAPLGAAAAAEAGGLEVGGRRAGRARARSSWPASGWPRSPGALSAVAAAGRATGARLAWIPRRAGERGAIEAGALPDLLPVGRPVTDTDARVEVARAWGVASLPSVPGRDTAGILAAAAAGELGALVVAGVDPADLPDPAAALGALAMPPFVVSLELRVSAVTDRADVVLPVAAVAEKAGTFVDWEGRGRPFGAALPTRHPVRPARAGRARRRDGRASRPAGRRGRARRDRPLGTWRGARQAAPAVPSRAAGAAGSGEAVLATWHQLLDAGRMQDGEPYLAGTARPASARLSPGTAAEAGVADGDKVTVATERGSCTLPVEVTDMPDRVVWLPANSAGCAVRAQLGAAMAPGSRGGAPNERPGCGRGVRGGPHAGQLLPAGRGGSSPSRWWSSSCSCCCSRSS